MRRGVTGHHVDSSVAGETIHAFVPDPLPPTPAIEVTAERQKLMEKALLACGRLDSITTFLPDPDLFLYSYLRREAVLSSQIEGTQSSLSDLLLFEMNEAPGVPFDDVVEVSGYVSALQHGLDRLAEGFPLCNRLLREIHAIMLSRGRGADKNPGEFRTTQNWIGGTRPGNAHFVSPPPQDVETIMSNLESFLHSAYPAGTLVRSALVHVQFETIHPFLDGNGRIGRLLIALFLHQEGVLHQPLLYLSLYFKRHRDEYYRLLDTVRYEGDWEAWLDFFLKGVVQTAASAVETAHRLLALFNEDGDRIKGLGRASASTIRIFDILRHRPVAGIDFLAKSAGVSYPTAARAVDSLQRLRILKELTGRKRGRIFSYSRYLAILNEGSEPI